MQHDPQLTAIIFNKLPSFINCSNLLISNARVLLPDGSFQTADVWVEGGVIREIGPNLNRFRKAEASPTADIVIDANGYDADLILVDLDNYHPVLREELQTKCGWSPFEGWNLTSWPAVTIVGGQVVYDRGQFNQQVRDRALRFEV